MNPVDLYPWGWKVREASGRQKRDVLLGRNYDMSPSGPGNRLVRAWNNSLGKTEDAAVPCGGVVVTAAGVVRGMTGLFLGP